MQLGWEYENCSLDAMSCQHSAWQHDVMNVGRMFWKCCANACGNQLHFTVTLNRKTYTNDQLLNERFVRMQMDNGGTQLHWNTCIFQMSHHVTPTGRTCNYILLSSLYLHVYLLNCINQYILFDFFVDMFSIFLNMFILCASVSFLYVGSLAEFLGASYSKPWPVADRWKSRLLFSMQQRWRKSTKVLSENMLGTQQCKISDGYMYDIYIYIYKGGCFLNFGEGRDVKLLISGTLICSRRSIMVRPSVTQTWPFLDLDLAAFLGPWNATLLLYIPENRSLRIAGK